MFPIAAASSSLGLDRVEPLTHEFLGHPLWQYVAFSLYLMVAVVLGLFVAYWFNCRLKKLRAINAPLWRQELTRLGKRPLALLAFLWMLSYAVRVFEWSPEVATMLTHVCTFIGAIALTFAALAAIELAANHVERRLSPEDKGSYLPVIALVTNIARAFAIVVAIIVAAQNMGLKVTGLVTTLGIGGIATALAAQETLSNLFGCIVLFADRPFHVGDRIKMDVVEGVVERIGLRSTRLRMADGTLVTVPNRTLAGAVIYNYSRKTTG